jgi:hypothetical protein
MNLNLSHRADRRISLAVRAACQQYGTPYPIVVCDGHQPPTVQGQPWHWETRGGRMI